MDQRSQIPTIGILLAIVAFIGLLTAGLEPALSIAVLILWVGSLFLASLRAPDTRAQKTEKPLSRDNMRELIEYAATPLLLTQANKIADANRAARKLLGRHIIGQDVRVAFRQPEAIALLDQGRNGTAIVRGLVRRRDIWQIKRQTITDNLAVIELVNQTAEADISRAHTDFVANASHELRTPLASIIGYVETLSEDAGEMDPSTTRKFYGTVLRESRRLQSLVSDLMSLSRVEAEKHDQPSERISFPPLLERAARDAAGAERTDRLIFDVSTDAVVAGDAQQLEQLVRNLVDNAFNYGANDKPVTVSLHTARDNQVRLTVADQGEGIAPEHIPHLTRRFYRTDPGRSRASGGTGLGLAIVKHIVERHRGRLDISSTQGEGTSVTVRFPVVLEKDDSQGDEIATDATLS